MPTLPKKVKKMTDMEQDEKDVGSMNQVWVFSGRWGFSEWTTEMALEQQPALAKFIAPFCDDYIFQLEKSETGFVHYQMFIKLKNKTRAKTLAILWNQTLRGIELSQASINGKDALKRYAMKDETRIAGPWGMKEIYMGEDLITDLVPWQRDIDEYVQGPINDREIIWVCDKVGAGGKTALAKYLAYHRKAVFLGWGNTNDILNLVSKMESRIYVFNLTRTKPTTMSGKDFYAALESIKDGAFPNTKYETKQVLMKPPHVIVFANCMPAADMMSADRFTTVVIDEAMKPPVKAASRFKFTSVKK